MTRPQDELRAGKRIPKKTLEEKRAAAALRKQQKGDAAAPRPSA